MENLRLNEVKRRLSTPKRTLDTVAASVGFPDREAFRRALERRFGAKPRRYLASLDLNGEGGGNSNSTLKIPRDDAASVIEETDNH